MGLIKWALAGAAGYGLFKYFAKDQVNAAYATGEGSQSDLGNVRNAGPDAMRDKPDDWQELDEMSDESFPASDPGAKY